MSILNKQDHFCDCGHVAIAEIEQEISDRLLGVGKAKHGGRDRKEMYHLLRMKKSTTSSSIMVNYVKPKFTMSRVYALIIIIIILIDNNHVKPKFTMGRVYAWASTDLFTLETDSDGPITVTTQKYLPNIHVFHSRL